MNFRQSVLREHLCAYVVDPKEPCIALRCATDDPDMSLYHQFVKKPDQKGFFPDKIHMIASPSKVKKASSYFKNAYGQKPEEIGETYCVSPYTIGFARFGKDDEKNLKSVIKIISLRSHFHTYVRSWVDTPEGYRTMLRDFEKDDVDRKSPDTWDKALADGEQSSQLLNNVKDYYVYHYAYDTSWDGHKEFKQKRIDELRKMTHPLTDDQLTRRYQHYYTMTHNEEDLLRDRRIADYASKPRLLYNVIAW